MKISIIGPGIIPIPPKGWGAVEILIYDYATELNKRGHIVQIVNTKDHNQIINAVNDFNPDFVHLQYDDHIDVMNRITCSKKAVTSHYGYLTVPQKRIGYDWIFNKFIRSNCNIFCLSQEIIDEYKKYGANPDKLFLTPNGANHNLFNYKKDNIKYIDKSIYLAKIDERKRQAEIQYLDSDIHFVGNCVDGRFNTNKSNYLGEWTKDYLYANLTEYANLILLSDGEAHPLVCVEAMMAGLGLVINKQSSANLDTTLPFITVISEEEYNNHNILKEKIKQNRIVSLKHREEIRKYALEKFSWEIIVDNYLKIIEGLK
jgi:glycosyltransferase involved in cell wall biosynthesis